MPKKKPQQNRAGGTDVSNAYDRCQTPPYAVWPLIPYLKALEARLGRTLVIWEPAAGDGYLARTLREFGFIVIEGDILTGQNFHDPESEPLHWDVIVTNPPYAAESKYPFIARCYALCVRQKKAFALIVQYDTGAAWQAQQHMRRHGAEEMRFDKRVDFGMPVVGFDESQAQFPTIWLCYHLLPTQIVYVDLDKPKRPRGVTARRKARLAAKKAAAAVASPQDGGGSLSTNGAGPLSGAGAVTATGEPPQKK